MARIIYYLCFLFPLFIPVLSGTLKPRTNANPPTDFLRLPSSSNLSSYADILRNTSSIVNSTDPQDASHGFDLASNNSSSGLSLKAPGGPLGAPELTCEKEAWGAPSLASCQQAIDSLPGDNNIIKIGRRGETGNFGLTVPWQAISPDGSCTIEIRFQPRRIMDPAEELTCWWEIKHAATTLAQGCVQRHGAGGALSGQGSHERMVVLLRGHTRSYPPRDVHCFNEPAALIPPAAACAKALDLVPFSQGDAVFGRAGVVYRLNNILPKAFSAPGGHCDAVLDVVRPEESDHSSWLDLWYAANTVYWKCVKQGKGGEVVGLGTNGNLRLGLLDGTLGGHAAATS